MDRTSRFDSWTTGRARAVLGLFVAVVVWALARGPKVPHLFSTVDAQHTDSALYRAIARRVADGQSYYDAVRIEQPRRGYPTSPVMAVREPTLAWGNGYLGEDVMRGVLVTLMVVALGLTIWRLEKVASGKLAWVMGCLCVAASVAGYATSTAAQLHEVWAGLLLWTAFLLVRDETWAPAIVVTLVAACVRELVAPVLMLALVMALLRRRRSDTLWAAGALAVFLAFYGWHAWEVHHVVGGAGPSSQGWLDLHGWPFMANALWFSGALSKAPFAVAAVVWPLAFVGWASRRGAMPTAIVVVAVCYALGFSLVGRWDNVYWGLLVEASLAPGLAFAPRGMFALVRAAGLRRSDVTQAT